MDQESIIKFIQGLGKLDFDKLVDVILRDVYHIVPVNVDRKGDRGSDRRVMREAGGATSVAIQVTVQAAGWRQKCLEDAKRAHNELGSTRFFFFTSQPHEPGAMRVLEATIQKDEHMMASCLGGTDLAGVVAEHKLLGVILDALGVPHTLPTQGRPDNTEIMLNAYVALGTDTLHLREGVYDDTLIVTLHQSPVPLTRQELLTLATTELGDVDRVDPINRRVDSLLSRGLLVQQPDGSLSLSSACAGALAEARRAYEVEFRDLLCEQARILSGKISRGWDEEAGRRACALLARAFVKEYLDNARDAKMELRACDFIRKIGDPIQDLRDLLREHDVPHSEIQPVLEQLAAMARNKPLIGKLLNAALFIALEGANPLASVKALGAMGWNEVLCVLDASVAIPYLCTRLYRPTEGRYARVHTATIRKFRSLGADVRIPFVYLQESAMHLVRARDYQHLRDFDKELEGSSNGYVSHYYQLRRGGNAPETLLAYLASFSDEIRRASADRREWARRIVPELQAQFRRHDVEFQQFRDVPEVLRREVEIEYSYVVQEDHHPKDAILVGNDVTALANVRRMTLEEGKHVIYLTWDLLTLKAARRVPNCAWTISPDVASDFVQVIMPMSDCEFTSLSHRLARGYLAPEQAGSIILDRIVARAREKMEDWEFQQQMREFKERMLASMDYTKPIYLEWLHQATDAFLATRGIVPGSPGEAGSAADVV